MREPVSRERSGGGLNLRRWLTPGIGVKRWVLVVFGGLVLLALGVAHFIRQVTAGLQPGGFAETLLDLVTLQFLPFPLRGLVAAVAGITLVVVGAYKVANALTEPFRSGSDEPLVELIYQKRFLARGPRIVAIGGGTGLSTLLSGLKEHTSNLTAVVAVADDGGSSGVLREELGIPPVGDIRRCIAALADAEPLMSELLQYRFPGSPEEQTPESGGGLGGHAVGNLLIAAMTAVEDGDFEEGLRQMNRVLAVRGQVVPATATPLTLHAELADGTIVDGQSAIAKVRSFAARARWLRGEEVRLASAAHLVVRIPRPGEPLALGFTSAPLVGGVSKWAAQRLDLLARDAFCAAADRSANAKGLAAQCFDSVTADLDQVVTLRAQALAAAEQAVATGDLPAKTNRRLQRLAAKVRNAPESRKAKAVTRYHKKAARALGRESASAAGESSSSAGRSSWLRSAAFCSSTATRSSVRSRSSRSRCATRTSFASRPLRRGYPRT